jgi:hypothetical protein
MPRLHLSFVLAIILALPAAASGAAHAAKPSAADRAWIDSCVAQRKDSKAASAALRGYCTCMHEIVDDNQPYGITELEREFPPAHQSCWRKHRMR